MIFHGHREVSSRAYPSRGSSSTSMAAALVEPDAPPRITRGDAAPRSPVDASLPLPLADLSSAEGSRPLGPAACTGPRPGRMAKSSKTPDVVVAAGGLLERVDDAGAVRIAVLHRTRYRDRHGGAGDWVLPKGKLAPGETLEEAALREVAEETGRRPRIVGPSFPCRYTAAGKPKVVTFFRMTDEGVGPALDVSEVIDVVWLAPREALERLTYDTERAVVAQAYGP